MSYGTLTSNHRLLKPDQDDYYDIGVANDNMDIIDAALINYGPTEPPGSSYIILQLSDETGDGYYLETDGGDKKITNVAETVEEAKPGDIILV